MDLTKKLPKLGEAKRAEIGFTWTFPGKKDNALKVKPKLIFLSDFDSF